MRAIANENEPRGIHDYLKSFAIERRNLEHVGRLIRGEESLMDLNQTMALDAHSIGDRAQNYQASPPVERLLVLSSWMMALGTVRLVCMISDYAGALIEATRSRAAHDADTFAGVARDSSDRGGERGVALDPGDHAAAHAMAPALARRGSDLFVPLVERDH